MKLFVNRYTQLTLAAAAIFIFGTNVALWLYVYVLETVGDLAEDAYRLPVGLIVYITIATTLHLVAKNMLKDKKNMPFYLFAINMLLVVLCGLLLVPTTGFFVVAFF